MGGPSSGLPRSYLYVPADSHYKVQGALTRGADALIVDLEDAVALTAKETARESLSAWLRDLEAPSIEVWVRVNGGDCRIPDLAALAGVPAVTGLVLAKTESAVEVAEVAEYLSRRGDANTLLMPLLESASAILGALDIAQQPRVQRLQIGEVDLQADTGIVASDDDTELAGIRNLVVLASAAAGICPPVGAVSLTTSDTYRLERSTVRIKRQGFYGRCCIHPSQLPVVHAVFTPTEAEIADAERVLSDFDRAQRSKSEVILDSQGRMIDPAVVRIAQRVLSSVNHEEQ